MKGILFSVLEAGAMKAALWRLRTVASDAQIYA